MPEYARNTPLTETDLLPDPLVQLEHWIKDAEDAGMIEPTAMTLATVGGDGRPDARIVLFKGVHEQGLTFFTNYESRKGVELAQQPYAALVFWWDILERQVRVEGRVQRLSEELSRRYFYQRPRPSQLGAAVSQQSRPIATREELERKVQARALELRDEAVPFPTFWGGYRVVPERFEFWQGRQNRLHDRLVFQRADGGWIIERLQP